MRYYKYGNSHYLIDTEPDNDVLTAYTVIQVTDVNNHYEIGVRRKSSIQNCDEITEYEFYDRFNNVIGKIKNIIDWGRKQ